MSHSADGAFAPAVFHFEGFPVRAIQRDSQSWFVARDVCEVLDFADPDRAIRHLDAFELDELIVREDGVLTFVEIINESGLWHLIGQSRKPRASMFKRWAYFVALPLLRQSAGPFVVPQSSGSLLAGAVQ